MANNYSYFNDNNDDMEHLDKLAREINEKKNKYNLIKSVHDDFYKESIKNKNQLNEALQNDNFMSSYVKNDESSDDNLSELLQHLKNDHNENHSISESESISSNSNESIIRHLKKCNKCKSKIKLSFDNNHIKIKKKPTENFSDKKLVISFCDLKEYMTLILLGFLILLILYIFFKLK